MGIAFDVLKEEINATLSCGGLCQWHTDRAETVSSKMPVPMFKPHVERVIAACGALADRILEGRYDQLLEQMGLSSRAIEERKQEAAAMLSRSFLKRKIRMELGDDWHSKKLFPLGVLFHIGAGNMDGLSAYSVVEGLLVGNINLLKLPEAEQGISAFLLSELTSIEPELKPYIYVFDVPSADEEAMKGLAALADGIVVWGGDEAVMNVRRLAGPGKKIIEWGHKLSFAYATKQGMQDKKELMRLARHIIETKQLLCSSCQGIYVDTEEKGELELFCRRFLKLLEKAYKEQGQEELGAAAKNTLRVYVRQLEASLTKGIKVYKGDGVSVTRSMDPVLELSAMFGNCWVKPLPRTKIMAVLRKKKEYLQTVGLICADEEREELSALFCRSGAVRIRKGRNMSGPAGKKNSPQDFSRGFEAHDGEYPLRRYSKMVEMD